ncbi:MAG: glycosyltransferase [Bdellovibrionota bacterium]
MNSDPQSRVTACVVAHNEEQTIERCLEALFAQDFGGPVEILVVDNASTDSTSEIARNVGARLTTPDRRFSLVARKVNNLGAGRQTAVEHATTPMIAFTDADCLVPSNWISSLAAALDENRSKGVVAVGTSNQPPHDGSPFHQAQRLMFSSLAGNFGSEQVMKGSAHRRDVTHLPTCSVLYDRDALTAIGGFANSHRLVCEDVDVSYRLRARDARLMKLDTVEVVHHFRPSYRSWSKKIFRYGWGQVQVMRKIREHRRFKFMLPLLFALSFPVVALLGPNALLAWVLAYVGSVAALSLWLCLRDRRLDLFASMIPLYFITHFSYGAGLLAGAAGWSGGRGPRG